MASPEALNPAPLIVAPGFPAAGGSQQPEEGSAIRYPKTMRMMKKMKMEMAMVIMRMTEMLMLMMVLVVMIMMLRIVTMVMVMMLTMGHSCFLC